MVLPPVASLPEAEFGRLIPSQCSDKTTMWLRPAEEEENLDAALNELRSKRSAADPKDLDFVEFNGKAMVKYHIVNAGDME